MESACVMLAGKLFQARTVAGKKLCLQTFGLVEGWMNFKSLPLVSLVFGLDVNR